MVFMVRAAARRVACLFAAALLLGCAAGPPPAPAGAPLLPGLMWSTLHAAVGYAVGEALPASRVHVLRIDLRAPGVRVAVSPPQDRGLALDAMPSGRGALLSVNASFYGRGFVPLGITASAGQRWPEVMQPATAPIFGCTVAVVCGLRLGERIADEPAWHEVVAGRPWLVRDGRPRTAADDASCAGLCAAAHPRTAIGLDASGRWLFIVLAEGRRPPVAGLSLAQLAQLMVSLGVQQGLNLDGGGSSSLLIRGQSVMARPANEPALRQVANALHVFVDRPTR